MYKLLPILILSLGACSTSKIGSPSVITRDSIVERQVISYKRDTTIIPGDTILLRVGIPCPDMVYHNSLQKGNAHLVVNIKNGQLTADCHTDSLLHIVDSLRETLIEKQAWHSTERRVIITNTVTKIKYRVPTWCWYLLLLNVVYVVFKWRSFIGSSIKKAIAFIIKLITG